MKKIFSTLFKFGVSPYLIIFSTLLAFLSASLEGISIGLLAPIINGLVKSDFSFVNNSSYLKPVLLFFHVSMVKGKANAFIFLVLLIFFSSVFKNILQYISSLCTLYQVRVCTNSLRKKIYERYLSFGKLFFTKNNAGHLHQILVTYTNQIGSELYVIQNYLYNIFALLVYILIMGIVSIKLTLSALILLPILNFGLRWLIKKIESSSRYYSEVYSRMGSIISNALTCIPLVKANSFENKELERFSHLSNSVQNVEFSLDKKRAIISPVQEVFTLGVTLLLIGIISLFYFKEQSFSLGSSMVFLLVLRRSINLFGSFNSMKSSFAYLTGPFNEIEKIISNDDEKYFVNDGNKTFNGLKHQIRLSDVSLLYSGGVAALSKINFTIEKSKITALVGQSGAGKTSLINLIMRFYDPTSGSIFFDELDMKEFTLKSLRSKIALVSQETFLFNSTLRENLIYGLDIIPEEEEIIEVLKRSRLYDFVQRLPDRLESAVGDRGIKLSGGEKQRVSIARAMLKGAEILILDEATSSLDSETERLIQEALDELVKNKTVIVIAHRLSTIKHADKIIVLEEGRVVEEGKPDELIHKKGIFYKYLKAQNFLFEEIIV